MLDPHCMNCRRAWTREVLVESFPAAWVNGEFKKHREKVLIEREKQLLPETMPMVTRYREMTDIRNAIPQKASRLETLKREAAALNNEIYTDKIRVGRLERTIFNVPTQPNKKSRSEFTCPCPKEECRGFMDGKMVCGVCNSKACTDCGVLLDGSEHACDKDVAASFKAIQRQTKPCPKCAVPTFKVSGCNQMWCTSCHTAWDWVSENIVTGIIHNPHYFAFLRERSATGEIPRQPGDENCDRRRFPQMYTVDTALNREIGKIFGFAESKSEPYKAMRLAGTRVMTLQRELIHIHETVLPRLRYTYNNGDNADLRLKFLINEITEKELQIQLHRREKKREKDLAVRDIYEMACDTGRDVLWQIIDDQKCAADALDDLLAIARYANTHLAKIQSKYNMKVMLLGTTVLKAIRFGTPDKL
jgi:hypothetical protein